MLCQGNYHFNARSTSSERCFSNQSSWKEEYEGLLAQRNGNIIMHPEGLGQKILPGNFVIKKNEATGVETKVLLEHALGYFWALKVGVLFELIHIKLCGDSYKFVR